MIRPRWDDDLLKVTVPLGPPGRRAYVLTPQDGITPEEADRIAAIVKAWAMDGQPPSTTGPDGVSE